MKKLFRFSKPKIFVSLICIVLFILPFFWLHTNELELGGDSSRLYMYDPDSFMQSDSLYSIEPGGIGALRSDQAMLPFLFLLKFFYFIFHSSYIVICLLNSLKLVGAFLFMYLIVVEILKKHAQENKMLLVEIAGILAGLFYTFSPSGGESMQFSLIVHNQVFLNPMVFYLLLRFLISQKNKYLWFAILTTLIFSPNFTLVVPSVYAFFPLAFIFLGLYVTFCLGKPLPLRKIFGGIILFLGLHAFHLIPTIMLIFDPGNILNTRIFDRSSIQNVGVDYFSSVVLHSMVTKSFFYSYSIPQTQWTVFIAPLSIILGFLISRAREKTFTLIALFFFITTFLQSANITYLGNAMYKMLFYIPGFSMFRNFPGWFMYVQTFFYALLLGYAFFLIFSKLKERIVYISSILIIGVFVFNSWKFISGQILRQPHRGTNNVSTIIQMDPAYEKILSYLRNLPDDGKIFDFPLTEFGYQVVPGLNRGAYIGPSPISFLTNRSDFAGNPILDPFSATLHNLIKEKNIDGIKRLFGLLNVKYIFYNSDPRAYEEFFPDVPNTVLLKLLPDSASLANLVDKIIGEKVVNFGTYNLYYADKNYYLPHFFVLTSVIPYDGKKIDLIGQNTSFFVDTKLTDPRIGYIDSQLCTQVLSSCKEGEIIYESDIPTITYQKINPTKYKVIVSNANAPFFLIFSDKFHTSWKAYMTNQEAEKLKIQGRYFDGRIQESYHENIFLNNKTFETLNMKSLPEAQHFTANGYANAWYITPGDFDGESNYEIIVEMTQQRAAYIGLIISFISIIIFMIYGVKILKNSALHQ
ncbi:MAG: hypothetical protein HYV37_02495 [Candidatus Levyibacteriota bacterium]|nr:MAG: hypothetical protein HYV37_02495 [Candidatus Levybacteria bacterium]